MTDEGCDVDPVDWSKTFPESATERGDRIERERVEAVRPVIRRQAELMLGLAGALARDAASGVPSQVAYVQAVRSGLNPALAEWVRGGCKS